MNSKQMQTTLFKVGGYILASLILFIWGVTFVCTKYLLDFLSPCEILLYRLIAAYIAFFVLDPHIIPPKNLKSELFVASFGLFGISLYFLLENGSLVFSTPSNVSLLVSACPLVTGLVSHIFTKKERFSGKFFIATIFCMTGIAFVVFNGRFILKLNPIGDAMALGAALSFAVYSVMYRDVETGYTTTQTTRKMIFYALLSFAIVCATPFVRLHPQNLTRLPVLGNLLFLGLFASALSTWGWNVVINKLGAVKANNLIYLTAPITMITSVLILHERVTIYAITGGFLIITGVFISQHIHASKKIQDRESGK